MPEARDNKPKVKQLSIVIKNADGTEQIIKKYTPEEYEALKAKGLDFNNLVDIVANTAAETINPLIEFLSSEEWRETLEQQKDNEDYIKALIPYIKAELRKVKHDENYKNVSVFDILQHTTIDGQPEDRRTRAALILDRAKKAKALADAYPIQPQYDVNRISTNNNTLINYMQSEDIISGGAFNLPTMKKNVTSHIEISFKGTDEYNGISHITQHERDVLDRVGTLYKAAQEQGQPCIIDGYIVGHWMPGYPDKVTDKDAEEIADIIEKFRHMFLNVDCTEEMRRRGMQIPTGDRYILNDYCLSTTGAEYRTKRGTKRRAYLINKLPLTLQYAEATNEVISINAEYFEIKKISETSGQETLSSVPVSMSKARQSYVSYMLRRIYIMKRDIELAKDSYRKYEKRREKDLTLDFKPWQSFCKKSNIIKIESIYAADDRYIDTIGQTQETRDREFFITCLKNWKLRGIISGYQWQKKDRKITGIKIEI